MLSRRLVFLTEPWQEWALSVTDAGERALAERGLPPPPPLVLTGQGEYARGWPEVSPMERALAAGGLEAQPCECGRPMDYAPAIEMATKRGSCRFPAQFVCDGCGAVRDA